MHITFIPAVADNWLVEDDNLFDSKYVIQYIKTIR